MSKLIALLEFRTGSDVQRYNTRSTDLLWGGFVWYAAPVIDGDVNKSAEVTKNGFNLEFPLKNAFASQYLGYGPDEITVVTLYRNTVIDEDDFQVYWKGRVADCEASDTTITLLCESIFSTITQAGLSGRMQKFCRHVVYHRGCNLDKDDFAVTSSVTAINAQLFIVTCPGAAAHPNGYFTGGMFTLPNGALRYIVNHSGNQISLWRPAPDVAAALLLGGVTTTLYPGCDGSLNTCNDRFNNLDNNGGFYWIPDVNPSETAVR